MKKIINLHKKIIALILIFIMSFYFIDIMNGISIVKADSNRYTYNNTNLDDTVYPGFKEKIDALKKAHPSWNFVIMETGLDWNQVITAEYAGHWGSPLSLIQGERGSWICPICGTHSYDNGSWYHASEDAIKYYMDARNWLNDDSPYILQFLQIGYVSTTDENIYNALNGTFLSSMENAKIINKVCKETNTNPYYIVARLLQEQGSKGGATWKMELEGNYYYNLFNIGASGNGTATIIANALAKAKENGWTSVESSLKGGINFLLSSYINWKQDTLYLQKFDVESYKGIYSHQYMQNIQAPTSEAITMYNKIKDTDLLNQSLTFVIPVFYNMPTSISESPNANVEIGAKNIKLKSGHSDWSIRSAKTTNSSEIGKIADSNTIVLSDERYSDGWHRIILTNGTKGYIYFNTDAWEEVDDVTNCSETVMLTGDQVNLRAGPGTDEAVITTLSQGQIVTRIDNSGRYNYGGIIWDRVKLSDGRQGFIASYYLAKTSSSTEIYIISAEGGLALRAEPNGDLIRWLGNGTYVTRTDIATAEVNGHYWDKITTPDGATGYVARDYIKDSNGNAPAGKTLNSADETNSKKDDTAKTITMEPNAEVSNLKTSYGDNISVTKADGTVVTSGQIGTGYKIKVNGTEFTAIKKGDVNGDGDVNTGDTFLLKQVVMNVKQLNQSSFKSSADINGDGDINTGDTFLLKKKVMGVSTISLN